MGERPDDSNEQESFIKGREANNILDVTRERRTPLLETQNTLNVN